jgi:hypothetical protein
MARTKASHSGAVAQRAPGFTATLDAAALHPGGARIGRAVRHLARGGACGVY